MAYAGSVNGTHHRRRGMRGLTLLAVVVLMLPAPTRAPAQACLGDCNTNLQVTIDELVRGVTIALAQAALSTCPSFDGDHSGAVEVYELVSAVNNSLAGLFRGGQRAADEVQSDRDQRGQPMGGCRQSRREHHQRVQRVGRCDADEGRGDRRRARAAVGRAPAAEAVGRMSRIR
jgi:hypothetical protein